MDQHTQKLHHIIRHCDLICLMSRAASRWCGHMDNFYLGPLFTQTWTGGKLLICNSRKAKTKLLPTLRDPSHLIIGWDDIWSWDNSALSPCLPLPHTQIGVSVAWSGDGFQPKRTGTNDGGGGGEGEEDPRPVFCLAAFLYTASTSLGGSSVRSGGLLSPASRVDQAAVSSRVENLQRSVSQFISHKPPVIVT